MLTKRERHIGYQIFWFTGVCAVVALLYFFSGCKVVHAYDGPVMIDESSAVNAIIGEAQGEGYRGMYAVACAIRNRGTLNGVYGGNSLHNNVSGQIMQQAMKAWYESAVGEDVTHGADHWDSVERFGKPWWASSMTRTAIIGHHCFYKSKKKA